MRTVEFMRRLDPDTFLRVRFDIERGRVRGFVVQLECQFVDEYHPVVRYDTAHGFAHRDLLHPSGQTDKADIYEADLNQALNFAIADITAHWHDYRRRYEQWLRQRKQK